MAQVRGSQTLLTLFEESTFGSDPGTPDGQKIYYESVGIKMARALDDDPTITGSRGKAKPALGVKDPGGSIAMKISAQSAGTLYKHAMGVNATTGADPYVHTMTLGDLPTSMVFERDNGSVISGTGRFEKFNGSRIGTATWDFPKDGFPTAAFDIISSDSTYASSALDATVTDNGHTAFHISQMTVIEEGGSAIAYVESANITLNNELDTDTYVLGGGGVRRASAEGFAAVTGSITALFESMALLNKARDNTASSLKITLSRGDGLGSSGNESIEFLVQQLDFGEEGPEISGPGGVMVTLPFSAYKSGSDLGLQITIKNAVATI